MATQRLVYGVGPVEELLGRRAREIAVLYVNPSRRSRQRAGDPVAAVAEQARRRGVSVEELSREQLDALVAGRGDAEDGGRVHHQGVVALVGAFEYAALEDLIAAPRQRPALFVALDSVTDPHNLGAIVRSAHVLGADGVILPKDRAAQVSGVVTKVSAGATEQIAIAQVTNLARALEQLKQAEVWIAGLAAGEGATSLPAFDATGALCLVLGAEGTGLRPLVARTCDFLIEIPMLGAGVGSLNVSVAAGVALYEVARQRAAQASASA
ncbi:23S rRNA (guanosine(2251)-2'-O)-methyltransferase RlmB [Haliangium ochraceum]|uniref:RNA methyltransferase, TrmH family, group 3 n=1 Tax=Haliangium ochraceum (strain DSM 14365 / JCM 11303 / SMP-2) TaxID=502025 RepID=D0LZ96_HALO1|nr:23S rRNA (guanosine(2251)-2'-O)-methyltransferase RlmB [Haliangium ochraceum]ACY16358.1 RNA methyltransferase, TrmH family, group 3 [Haliangium ochraceum DSM 14365]